MSANQKSVMDQITAMIETAKSEGYNQAVEDAARQAELRMVFGGEPPTPHHQQVIEHIAAAIRGLKR